MSERLPIIYTAHHASHNFGEFTQRCALTPEQRLRFSDYGTAQTVPTNGVLTLVGEYSRGIIDLNRAPNDSSRFPQKDFSKPVKNPIWLPDLELTEAELQNVSERIYDSYHNRIIEAVHTFKQPGLVVAWDNTAHYMIGANERGEQEMMRPFILSNQGAENSTESDGSKVTTCDPEFLQQFAYHFARSLGENGLPNEIVFNLVFKGGYIAQHYNTRRNPTLHDQSVQSFQIEYDAAITHSQETLKPDLQAMEDLKKSFEEAIYDTYLDV